MSVVVHAAAEGYATPTSVRAGDTVEIHCSSTVPEVTIEVARVGATRDVVLRRERVPVQHHAIPDDAASKGCRWPATLAIPVDPAWRSGFYEVVFHAPGVEPTIATSQAYFIVRSADPGRDTAIVLALSTTTWNAYNDWGGPNLYMAAARVAFDRPLPKGFIHRPEAPNDRLANETTPGDRDMTGWLDYFVKHGVDPWCGAAGWFNWERRFVRWAEAAGHRIDYLTGLDLHHGAHVLDPYRLYLSVGHDEYWSWEMRDAVEGFVGRGGNAAFFSGNTAFWQVRVEDGVMVCWKDRAPTQDPVQGPRMSGLWSHPSIGRPENEMTGVTFARAGYARAGGASPAGAGGYTIHRPDHWIFDGADVRYGDVLGAAAVVVGYETDGCALRLVDGLPEPTHEDGTPESFVVLGTAPARLWSNSQREDDVPLLMRPGVYMADADGNVSAELEVVAAQVGGDLRPETLARFANGHCVMGVYERGGTVFTSGCTDWAYGLGRDPKIDRVTTNLLTTLARRG